MTLVKMVVVDTMMIAGFERHTFRCSKCNDIEQRFVFNNKGKHSDVRISSPPVAPDFITLNNQDIGHATDNAAPSLATGSIQNDQLPTTQTFWSRFFAKMRRRWISRNA